MIQCSICLATKDKAEYLDRTLESIRNQVVPFEYEISVADDGSVDNTKKICDIWGVDKYSYIENNVYRNPSVARNVAYKQADGDIIIAQSDDVMHVDNAIEVLCNRLHKGEFIIATVHNWDVIKSERKGLYTGMGWQRPFFFLGSLGRKDLYAVGGNDEEFVGLGYDDDWFGDCLTKGLRLRCVYRVDVKGYHQDHPRPLNLADLVQESKQLYKKKVQLAKEGKILWQSSSGPWEYTK